MDDYKYEILKYLIIRYIRLCNSAKERDTLKANQSERQHECKLSADRFNGRIPYLFTIYEIVAGDRKEIFKNKLLEQIKDEEYLMLTSAMTESELYKICHILMMAGLNPIFQEHRGHGGNNYYSIHIETPLHQRL